MSVGKCDERRAAALVFLVQELDRLVGGFDADVDSEDRSCCRGRERRELRELSGAGLLCM
jgi:hypothetical protein